MRNISFDNAAFFDKSAPKYTFAVSSVFNIFFLPFCVLGIGLVSFYFIQNVIRFILFKIYYRKLIIFLEVLKCRQSLMFQGFPAFLVTEDVLKSP